MVCAESMVATSSSKGAGEAEHGQRLTSIFFFSLFTISSVFSRPVMESSLYPNPDKPEPNMPGRRVGTKKAMHRVKFQNANYKIAVWLWLLAMIDGLVKVIFNRRDAEARRKAPKFQYVLLSVSAPQRWIFSFTTSSMIYIP